MGKTPTVLLLVDDNPAHRRLLRRALEKDKTALEIHEAEGLESARALVFEEQSLKPQFAIVDLNLGDGRGSQLVSELRAHQSFKTTPLIVISTSALTPDIRECYDAGADLYIVKDDDISQFGRDVLSAITYMLNFVA